MFDGRLRDKLLFEDKHFTYSRRYFWGYNTLGVINGGIKSMINAYTETFTRDFWTGNHRTLFPLQNMEVAEMQAYLRKLEPLRRELEDAIAMLHSVYDMNERTRQEIKSLRDQLFSGSSVKESRRAIEQGDNIKVLTSVSMIFLPLTFVTSVWSMTGFPLEVDTWQFPLTMILACVPFILFVCMLQTRTGMRTFKGFVDWVDDGFQRLGARIAARSKTSLPTHAGHTTSDKVSGNTNALTPVESRAPRRKRRLSRSGGAPKNVLDIPNDRRSWFWWRAGPKNESPV